MNNNRKLLELANSVLFSLPSTPVLRYGDEIGMGDNLALKERTSVRTPMQWAPDTAGGFSASGKAIVPVIDTGVYGYRTVNVAAELKQPNSLLNWTRVLIKVHKQCQEISFGRRKIIDTRNAHILAMRYEWQGSKLLVIHNFSKDNQKLSVTKRDAGGSVLKNLFSSGENLKTGKDNIHVALEGYGYRWYKVLP
jgi:maltose alpha-D-glucosyltransferase/alpha-amylase